jgi:hypothetical protein
MDHDVGATNGFVKPFSRQQVSSDRAGTPASAEHPNLVSGIA